MSFFSGSPKSTRTLEPAADLSQFDDPVARQAEWTHCNIGGQSFGTFALVMGPRPGRVEFKTTEGFKIFAAASALLGMGVIALSLQFMEPFSKYQIRGFMAAAGFFLAGPLMYFLAAKPRVFDKHVGCYWKGHRRPRLTSAGEASADAPRLNAIHAVQLIGKTIKHTGGYGLGRRYRNYELNLVLTNSRRINVIDHGNSRMILRDAKILADFLGVPLWNALPADA